MIITPLEVFASIQMPLAKVGVETQQLLVEDGNAIVVTNNDLDPDTQYKKTRHSYSDCQHIINNQFAHTAQLEQLIQNALQGYNSAGVFINTTFGNFDDKRQELTFKVLEQLTYQLECKNTQRIQNNEPTIKMEYGYIGFCDDHCFDYPGKRTINNFYAARSSLHSFLRPVNTIGDIFDLVGFTPRVQPSLLVFYLTDDKDFESTFAWIDLPPPSVLDGQHFYNKSYSELLSNTKQYTSLKRNEFIPSNNYSMSHYLLEYFSGSYQTMVFAHFDEFGTYKSGQNLDILQYTSNLRNIRCCINNEPTIITQQRLPIEESRIEQLQDEIYKRDALLEHYKFLYLQQQKEIDILKDKYSSQEFDEGKTTTIRCTSFASMKRHSIESKLQLAKMKHEMHQQKISLLHSKVSVNSYQLSLHEIETELMRQQHVNKQLSKLMETNIAYKKESEAKIWALQSQLKASATSQTDL